MRKVNCLTEEEKIEVAIDFSEGFSKSQLARDYNVSVRTIGRVIEEMSKHCFFADEPLEEVHIEDLDGLFSSLPETKVVPEEVNKFVLVPNSVIIITYNGSVYTVEASNSLFNQIVTLCVAGDFKRAVELSEPAKAITEFTKGDVTVKGDVVLYRGEEAKGGLADAILRLMSEGDEGFKKLVAFFDKVQQNPSYKSRHELFGFIKAKDIDIDAEGYLVCWKKIRHNWKDCYTGTIDNSVGVTVKMDREQVNDNSNQTCSAGLHVCAKSYLSYFGGERVIKVRVNPKDVVSVPTDYNDAKMRCSEYVVLEEVTDLFNNPFSI